MTSVKLQSGTTFMMGNFKPAIIKLVVWRRDINHISTVSLHQPIKYHHPVNLTLCWLPPPFFFSLSISPLFMTAASIYFFSFISLFQYFLINISVLPLYSTISLSLLIFPLALFSFNSHWQRAWSVWVRNQHRNSLPLSSFPSMPRGILCKMSM